MTIGVGGSNAATELAKLSNQCTDILPISTNEFKERIASAQQLMQQHNIAALYLNAGTNLFYFTGTRWHGSERMVGAILPVRGAPIYIVPYFEQGTILQFMGIPGDIVAWQEHQSPYQLFIDTLNQMGIEKGEIGIDEATPFFISNGIASIAANYSLVCAKQITAGCRAIKSAREIALMQSAKDITLTVQKATARILREGISTAEVTEFIDAAHRKMGATKGSYFCIVLFGIDSSFPHGVKNPQPLKNGEMVLIDTGCMVENYISDITRSYVFGEPSPRQRELWNVEKNAQQAAFNAAVLGEPCANVDIAARAYLASQGMGPDYQTPGCPHRTGHGIGLDIHEWPYLNRAEDTLLAIGMCFSNEPMLVIPNEFGIRLEDHFYMSEAGPVWFTEPSFSIDDPFCYQR
ncbi:MAG: putative metal-dependent dipeptidase [Osedax symbiont Rs1]|nr:MAG: putative metal-dependent dipeptidase [Osedax symbiont Rs1]